MPQWAPVLFSQNLSEQACFWGGASFLCIIQVMFSAFITLTIEFSGNNWMGLSFGFFEVDSIIFFLLLDRSIYQKKIFVLIKKPLLVEKYYRLVKKLCFERELVELTPLTVDVGHYEELYQSHCAAKTSLVLVQHQLTLLATRRTIPLKRGRSSQDLTRPPTASSD